MGRRLTIGMRCRLKPESHWAKDYGWTGKEVLLEERSQGSFSVMVLGQQELKKKDPNTVINQVAWVDEDDLEFIDANFEANMEFMDWYQEHEEDFCADCGAWFPNRGVVDPATKKDYICPNEDCPGALYDAGKCPHCKIDAVDSKCPKCDFEFNL